MNNNYTISSHLFRAILNGFNDKIDLNNTFFSKIGVTQELFSNPDYRIDKRQIQLFWEVLDDEIHSSYLGLEFGSKINISELGITGMFFLYSTSIREAIEKQISYSRVLSSFLDLELKRASLPNTERLEIKFDKNHPKPEYAIQCQTIIMVNTILELVGSQHHPLNVYFNFDIPEKEHEKFRSFFKCPVLFNKDFNAITYKTTTLDKKLTHRDSRILGYIEKLAKKEQRKLVKDHCLSEKVSDIVKEQIYSSSQVISLSEIAKYLNISGRTLQRKLKQEFSSYSAILENVRKQEAITLLEEKKLNVNEIAWFLGYSEASTFIYQFKNWMGTSPSSFRKK